VIAIFASQQGTRLHVIGNLFFGRIEIKGSPATSDGVDVNNEPVHSMDEEISWYNSDCSTLQCHAE
jgi:hypothetical protein